MAENKIDEGVDAAADRIDKLKDTAGNAAQIVMDRAPKMTFHMTLKAPSGTADNCACRCDRFRPRSWRADEVIEKKAGHLWPALGLGKSEESARLSQIVSWRLVPSEQFVVAPRSKF